MNSNSLHYIQNSLYVTVTRFAFLGRCVAGQAGVPVRGLYGQVDSALHYYVPIDLKGR